MAQFHGSFSRMKIKTGDLVVVITGKDRGKKGKVLRAFPRERKILVEKVNLVKKHQKAAGKNPGGILETEAKIDASNVKIICPKTQKSSRVGFETQNNRKIRVAKISGAPIETPFVKK